jgi:regulator of sigma E protease
MGENNEGEHDPRSFVNRPFWGRLGTLVAGVTMNWILAAVLFSVVLAVGTTSEIDPENPRFKNATITNHQVAISQVVPESPAQKAGLQREDIVLTIDGRPVANYNELSEYISQNKGKAFDFQIKRINEIKNVSVQSNASPPEGQGPTGIGLTDIAKVRFPWYQAIGYGIQRTIDVTGAIVMGIIGLFSSSEALGQVGGPIKIAQLTGQVADLGIVPLLNFTALLSINLAILNILPFPALDGGRVLFLLIEKIRGKRNNQKVEQWFNTFGFLALLLLMVVVTAKDISGFGGIGRIFSKLFGG